jgi:hypothetical protein
MTTFLRIAQWNANGLQHHQEELKIFLKANNVDILLISETHFTDKNYFKIPTYKTYSTNHPDGKAHGGTAIIVKETIGHYPLQKYEEAHIQATAISLTALPYPCTVAAVYCPPRHNLKKIHYETFFQTLGKTFIAGGDYNSKHTYWGSRLSTTKGRELLATITDNNYSYISTGTPTYWPSDAGKIPDLLDFFIIKNISPTYINIAANLDLSSDHTPIIATISTTVLPPKPNPKLHTSNTNWDLFQQIVEATITLNTKLKTQLDIDQDYEHFISILQEAAKAATPKILNSSTLPAIPLQIKKNDCRKKGKQSRYGKKPTSPSTNKNSTKLVTS